MCEKAMVGNSRLCFKWGFSSPNCISVDPHQILMQVSLVTFERIQPTIAWARGGYWSNGNSFCLMVANRVMT